MKAASSDPNGLATSMVTANVAPSFVDAIMPGT